MRISYDYENLFTVGQIKIQPLNFPENSTSKSNRFASNRISH